MKNVQKVIAGVVFGAAGMGAAQAEWSANIGVASSYIFRGIEFSDDAAVSGGLDWSSDISGLYAGTWITSVGGSGNSQGVTVKSGNEVDIYGGYAFDLGGGLGLDLGAILYLFPSDPEGQGSHGNNSEIYVGLGGSYWSTTVWYNFGFDGNFTGVGDSGDEEFVYVEANYEVPLRGQFSLGLHAGYTALTGDDYDRFDDPNNAGTTLDISDNGYIDYGVSVNAGDFSLAVTATDLDDDHDLVEAGFYTESDRPVVTVSWSKTWEGLGNAK